MRRVHTRKFGAHTNVPSKNVFYIHFTHVVPNSDEFWKSVAQQKFDSHKDFKKLEGTLLTSNLALFHVSLLGIVMTYLHVFTDNILILSFMIVFNDKI